MYRFNVSLYRASKFLYSYIIWFFFRFSFYAGDDPDDADFDPDFTSERLVMKVFLLNILVNTLLNWVCGNGILLENWWSALLLQFFIFSLTWVLTSPWYEYMILKTNCFAAVSSSMRIYCLGRIINHMVTSSWITFFWRCKWH